MKSRRTERGSALIAAMFLIVVVVALGVFAARLGANQQQVASLELAQFRAIAAANAGLEFWSNRINSNSNVACGATPAFDGHALAVVCILIASAAGIVYDITCTASRGTYGTPDFVRRSATRRVTTIAPGVWSAELPFSLHVGQTSPPLRAWSSIMAFKLKPLPYPSDSSNRPCRRAPSSIIMTSIMRRM